MDNRVGAVKLVVRKSSTPESSRIESRQVQLKGLGRAVGHVVLNLQNVATTEDTQCQTKVSKQ